MRCHVAGDTECTKSSCPFWTADDCTFAEVDFAGRDDVANWLNTIRLTLVERASVDGAVPTFHRALASGKE
jgi:hypothetical protein